ncbi:hypothetical protein R3P38DRAFT_3175445 [Favolaschia claudopus]|uniref:Uncharacterized protein n=1 Tax=Favolaschia claudopus TaxID=2862362 RepID=A0AAW0DFP5_9AGAR
MGRRGRPGNFDEGQWELLVSEFPNFEAAQRSSTLGKFWPKVEGRFFESYPEAKALGISIPLGADGEPDLTSPEALKVAAGEDIRRKQLNAWFYNYANKLKKDQDTVLPSKSGSLAATLFKTSRKKTRRLQQIEIYLKRNSKAIDTAMRQRMKKLKHSSKRKGDATATAGAESDIGDPDGGTSGSEIGTSSDEDDSADSEGGDVNKASGSMRRKGKEAVGKKRKKKKKKLGSRVVGLRRKVAQEMFDVADEEEKAAVHAAYVQQQPAIPEDALNRSIDEREPSEVQDAIDELDGVVDEVHQAIFRLTGFMGYSVFAGPSPEDGGDIITRTYCSGQTLIGRLNFPQSYENWEEVIAATGQWVKRCVSRETRAARALKPTPTPMVNDAEDPALPQPNQLVDKNGLPKKPTKKQIKAQKAAAAAAKLAAPPPATQTTSEPPLASVAAVTPPPDAPTPLNATLDGLLPFDDFTPPPVSSGLAPDADMFDASLFDLNIPMPSCADPNSWPPWYDPPLGPSLPSATDESSLPTPIATLTPGEHAHESTEMRSAVSPNATHPNGLSVVPPSTPLFVFGIPPLSTSPDPNAPSQPPLSPVGSPREVSPEHEEEERFPLQIAMATSTASTPVRHRRRADFSPSVSSPLAVHSPTRASSPPSPRTSESPALSTPPSIPSAPPAQSTAGDATSSPSETKTASGGRLRGMWDARKEEWKKRSMLASTAGTSSSTPSRPTPKRLPKPLTPSPVPLSPSTSTPAPSLTPPAGSAPSTPPTPIPALPFVESSIRAPPAPSAAPPAVPASPPPAAPPAPSAAPTSVPPSTPPIAPPSVAPSPASTPPIAIPLSANSFPISRTHCNPPPAPRLAAVGESAEGGSSGGRGGGRGRGRGRGRGGRGRGGGGRGRGGGQQTAREAGYTFLQTYQNGEVIPLSLDTPLPPSMSQQMRRKSQAGEKEREPTATPDAATQVPGAQASDGVVVFLPPLKPQPKPAADGSAGLLPVGSKRVRKPAPSREMPIPISMAAKTADAEGKLLEQLEGVKKRMGIDAKAGKKRKNENTDPQQKK